MFKVPSPPKTACDDGMVRIRHTKGGLQDSSNNSRSADVLSMHFPKSSILKRQPSRGVSKRGTVKSRAKSHGKSRAPSVPSSQQRSGIARPVSNTNARVVDADLNEIYVELDGIEQRANQILSSVQRDITTCVNYMLDSIMAGITTGVDSARAKLPEVNKMRQANRSVKSQLRALDDLGNA